MPASSTKDLRNYKGHFRAATRSLLDAAGWSDAVLERTLTKLSARARREISFDLGEALNEEVLPNGLHVYDYFPFSLRVRVVTARRQAAPDPEIVDLHDRFVAEVLDLFAEEKRPFTEALLPYYAVKMLRVGGTRSDLDLIEREDYTDVLFNGQFGIRSSAWPLDQMVGTG
jgi:hypothetical protein